MIEQIGRCPSCGAGQIVTGPREVCEFCDESYIVVGVQPGDRIGLPDEPPVGTRLRIFQGSDVHADYIARMAVNLDLVRRPEGWYYTGFLDADGEPLVFADGKKTDPWDWGYVISTHKQLVYVTVGSGTWE